LAAVPTSETKATDLAQRVLRGDRRAVARAISLVEDGAPELADLSAALYPHTGSAYTIGLTGSPGVGKSSLVSALAKAARARDVTVAVLAIDPTSPFSGGALLGDRVRMQSHATDPGVFIRSMATRGHLGGMALAAPEAIRILDASGRDLVIVETVGVGQAEVEIATAADTTLVVVAPGWGDAVQVAKAGILEIADVFVVNKADRDGTNDAVRDLNLMVRQGPRGPWTPPVVRTSTVTGEGVDDLWDAIAKHRAHGESSGDLAGRRGRRLLEEVQSMVAARLHDEVGVLLHEDAGASIAAGIEARSLDPYAATRILLDRMRERDGDRARTPGGTR
jgi:LAO/AO transport system kinase